MTHAKYIKQAIIASLVDHPDQEKYRTRAFKGENLEDAVNALGGRASRLTKADFLAPDEEGIYIIDTPGFWQNMGKVLSYLKESGEHFTYDDFMIVTNPSNNAGIGSTLLESAQNSDNLDKVFNADIWRGRFDEMERLWFHVPVQVRKKAFGEDGHIPLELKRDLLAAEGRKAPEDGLAAAGITRAEFFGMFRERGNYEEILRKLANNGDYLRKDYILMVNDEGNTIFNQDDAWKHYDHIVTNMRDAGENLDPADLVRRVGTRANILMRGSEKNMLHHVFTPEHWVDRLEEMLATWRYVLDAWRVGELTTDAFDKKYAAAENLTYSPLIDFTAINGKADLLTPLNAAAVTDGAVPVRPLGLAAFWDHFEDVRAHLATKEEQITLDDLRQKSGAAGMSCLMNAVKCGHFEKVLTISADSKMPLTLDDYLQVDRDGERHAKKIIDILAENEALPQVFDADLWVGRLAEMRALWNHVRSADKTQVDYARVEVSVRQKTMRQQAGSRRPRGFGR